MLAADLSREIFYPQRVYWIKVSSYEGTSGSTPEVVRADVIDSEGTNILVDTIVDSGRTVTAVREFYADMDLKVAALLVRQSSSVVVDFKGMLVPEGFVVGYGLDYNGEYRHLPDIRVLTVGGTREGSSG
jgi:hypoxanthine phosphoribosyltransferase